MKRYDRNTFFCFSPFIMAMTVIIELTLLIRLLLTRKYSLKLGLALLILFCLALFQAAEYVICETNVDQFHTGQIGLISITALPVLGVHLVQAMRGRKANIITQFAYATMIAWWFAFIVGAPMKSQGCTGNYVILEFEGMYGVAYFVYYYFWMVVASIMAIVEASLPKVKKSMRFALIAYVVGYACFIIPATIIWLTVDGAAKGLPSIMCGFAVIFAIILGVLVMPQVTDKK